MQQCEYLLVVSPILFHLFLNFMASKLLDIFGRTITNFRYRGWEICGQRL